MSGPLAESGLEFPPPGDDGAAASAARSRSALVYGDVT